MFFITAGLPPLLLAQDLPAQPVLAVRARVRRDDGVAEGPAVVGRAPPQPPPLLRHRARRALAQARLLVEPRRLDPLRQVQPGRPAAQIRDFAKYPELRFINKHDWIGPWTLGVVCFLIGGWSGLLIGFFASTVLLWHVTFTVNSVAHVMGRRAYETERHEPQHAARRARDRRRGLAQQPPPLPVVGPPGLPLVADRHDLLRAARAQLGRHRPRPQAGAGRGHRRSARRQGSTSSFGYFSVVASTAPPSTPDDRAAGSRTARARAASHASTNCTHAGCVAFDCTEW